MSMASAVTAVAGASADPSLVTMLPGVPVRGRPAGPRPDLLVGAGSLLLAEVVPGSRRSWREHVARLGPLPELDLDALGDAAEAAGLRGYGGAGFPTATKLRSMRDRGPALVVVNAAEGEHASGKDGALLRHVPHLVLDGAALAARALGAGLVTVRVSADRPDLPDAVNEATAERGHVPRVQVSVGPATFTAGEASAVVNALAGGPALPSSLGRPPRVPSRLLRRGKPVLVSNVETFARLALAARSLPSASALLTLSGAVSRPGVVELPESARLVDAVRVAGGASEPIAGVVTGGWHGRWLPWGEPVAEATLSREGLAAVGGRRGAGVVVALPSSACRMSVVAAVARTLADASAGQCGPCRAGLPFAAAALSQAAASTMVLGPALADAEDSLASLSGRGLCAHPTASVAALNSAIAWAQPDIELHRHGRCLAR